MGRGSIGLRSAPAVEMSKVRFISHGYCAIFLTLFRFCLSQGMEAIHFFLFYFCLLFRLRLRVALVVLGYTMPFVCAYRLALVSRFLWCMVSVELVSLIPGFSGAIFECSTSLSFVRVRSCVTISGLCLGHIWTSRV